MRKATVLIVAVVALLFAGCDRGPSQEAARRVAPKENEAVLLSSSLRTASADDRVQDVSKYCIDGFVWLRVGYGKYAWGGQQLDQNGKPIPCPKREGVG